MADKISEETKLLMQQRPELFEESSLTFGITPESKIKSSDFRDDFRQVISPFIRGTMVGGGATIGALAATPAIPTAGPGAPAFGGALGGTAGDLTYQQLQRLNPRIFGAPPDSIPEGIADAQINALLEVGTRGIFNRFGPSLLKKIFPNKASKVQLQGMLEEGHQIPLDVQDVTQSGFAGLLKNIFGGSKVTRHEAMQQARLKNEINKLFYDVAGMDVPGFDDLGQGPVIAKRGAEKALGLSRRTKSLEQRAWNLLTKQMLPRQRRHGIEAPINIKRTHEFALRVKEQLRPLLKKDRKGKATISKASKTQLRAILNQIEPFASPVLAETDAVISYKEAELARNTLNDMVSEGLRNPELKAHLKGVNQTLLSLIRKDIDHSIERFGPHYAATHKLAKGLTKEFHENYLGKSTGQRLLDPNTTKEAVLNSSLKNAENAAKYMRATGSNSELGEKYLRDLFIKSHDPETGFFDPKAGLTTLRDTDSVANLVLGENLKTNAQNLLGRMSAVNPKISRFANAAAYIRYGSAVLSIPAGLFVTAKTGNPTSGLLTAGAVVSTIPMGMLFTRKHLMNPKVGNDLLALMKTPANSQGAFRPTKSLLFALNGTRIYVQYSGQTQPATIQDGKVVLENQEEDSQFNLSRFSRFGTPSNPFVAFE
jgi:hypothetical protein